MGDRFRFLRAGDLSGGAVIAAKGPFEICGLKMVGSTMM